MANSPGLDHYVGRPFDCVIQGEEADDWAIKLSGGVLLKNRDGRRTVAPTNDELAGSTLLVVTMSELDTILHFGVSNQNGFAVQREITFTPALYSIAEPTYDGGNDVYPQRLDAEDAGIPPEPPADRVADGPENPQEVTEPQDTTP